jgi:hypothetical protein
MEKKKLFTLLYLLMMVVVIITCVVLIVWTKSESAMCLKDPLEFMMNKTDQMCYCIGN